MSKIKYTKHELKTQREALARFERFLPTLKMKKQRLEAELRTMQEHENDLQARTAELFAQVRPWLMLFVEKAQESEKMTRFLQPERITANTRNVAGVDLPHMGEVTFPESPPDLFETPPWWDDAIHNLRARVLVRIELIILRKGRALLRDELLTITQRVNFIEKVKIPEAKENIRRIKIVLGDQETAAVIRAKIAKAKSLRGEP